MDLISLLQVYHTVTTMWVWTCVVGLWTCELHFCEHKKIFLKYYCPCGWNILVTSIEYYIHVARIFHPHGQIIFYLCLGTRDMIELLNIMFCLISQHLTNINLLVIFFRDKKNSCSIKTMNEHLSSFYKNEINNIIFKVTLQISFDSFSYNF
jgi:hypothetical protein